MKTYPSAISIFDPSPEQLVEVGFDRQLDVGEKILWFGTPDRICFYFSSTTNILKLTVLGFAFLFVIWDFHAVNRLLQGLPVFWEALLVLQCALCLLPLLFFLAFQNLRRRLLYVVTIQRAIISCSKDKSFFQFGRILPSVRSLEGIKGAGFFCSIPTSSNLMVNLRKGSDGSGHIYFKQAAALANQNALSEKTSTRSYSSIQVGVSSGLHLVRSIRDISYPCFKDRFVGIIDVTSVASLLFGRDKATKDNDRRSNVL